MQDLIMSLIQTNLIWENIEGNLAHFSQILDQEITQTDVIVLPEMFTTGFTMRPELFYEEPNGRTLAWMIHQAEKFDALMIGSFILKEGGAYFNRLHAVSSSGLVMTYDKRHLFRMGKENEHYSAGGKKSIISYKQWNILPLICYDLRFPVWSRNKINDLQNSYDLLIYIANWPQRRTLQWQRLLIARAIENQCYVAGVNRLGVDGNGVDHCGDSLVVDYFGDSLTDRNKNVQYCTLSYAELEKYRKDFPAWQDADDFQINL